MAIGSPNTKLKISSTNLQVRYAFRISMKSLPNIFKQNQEWAEKIRTEDPNFFAMSAHQQTPKYLWIGCSDSRVPANQIMGLRPGDVFVHRNIANVVVHTDFNCLSVIQYAVEALKVEHIIVCGHYGCGGVKASLNPPKLGIIDNWLQHIEDIYSKFESQMAHLSEPEKFDRLCELNVIEQVYNVCRTTVVQKAWNSGQSLSIHGWIYALHDGLLRDLQITCDKPGEVNEMYYQATKPNRL